MLHILLFMVEMQQTLVEVSMILHQGNLKKKVLGDGVGEKGAQIYYV